MGRKRFVCAKVGKGMDFSSKKKALLKQIKEKRKLEENYEQDRKCGSV